MGRWKKKKQRKRKVSGPDLIQRELYILKKYRFASRDDDELKLINEKIKILSGE